MRNKNCTLCPLGTNGIKPKNPCLMSSIPKEGCDILIVAESPTQLDDTNGRIFSGKGLGEIAAFFGDTGLRVHLSYAAKCAKPGKDSKITDKMVKLCAANYLKNEIEQLKPGHIIVLGASALYGVTGKKGITEKLGNRFYDENLGYYLYVTIHQAQAAFDDQQKQTLWGHLNLFKRWVMGQASDDTVIQFNPPVHEINTLKKLRNMRDQIADAGWVAAVDTETDGLNPYLNGQHIRMIQFCWDVDYGGCYVPLNIGDGCYWEKPDPDDPTRTIRIEAEPYWTADEWPEVGRILRDLMENVRCIWHNGKFDRLWLHLWGEREFGFPIRCPHILMDTMHVAHMLDENRPLGLKKLITQVLGYPTYDISDKLTRNLSLLFPYAAKDTVASLMLAQVFSKQLNGKTSTGCRAFILKSYVVWMRYLQRSRGVAGRSIDRKQSEFWKISPVK